MVPIFCTALQSSLVKKSVLLPSPFAPRFDPLRASPPPSTSRSAGCTLPCCCPIRRLFIPVVLSWHARLTVAHGYTLGTTFQVLRDYCCCCMVYSAVHPSIQVRLQHRRRPPGYDAVPIGDATRTGRGAGCGLGGWRCSLGHVHYSDMYSSIFRFSAASSFSLY